MKKIKNVLSKKYFMFILTFLIMMFLTYDRDINSASMDAVETWKVIKTFFSSNKYYSYVMYKGIYSFIPGLISYYFGKLFHVSIYLLFKVFNALSFSYVCVYGVPNIVDYLFKNKKVTIFQRYLFIALMILLESYVIYITSVDMVSCFLFVLLINLIIKDKNSVFNYIFLGFIFGINLCMSGQFGISTYIVLAYYIGNKIFKNRKRLKKIVFPLSAVILSLFLFKVVNNFYMDYVVSPARDNGAWIPTGEEWIHHGLSANLLIINYPVSIPDNLSLNMVKEDEAYALTRILNGEDVYGYRTYIKMIIKYPARFMVRWSERLFLGMINDPQNTISGSYYNPYNRVILMAFIIYGFYRSLKDRYKKYKDFLCFDSIIYLSLLFSVLVPSFGHVENRYYFTFRCVIIGIFCLSPYLNNIWQRIKERKFIDTNYNLIGGVLFCLLALIIYCSLYQSLVLV